MAADRPPMPLHGYIHREHDSWIAPVDQIVPIVGIDNVYIVGVIPIRCPVFGPWINHAEPKAAVLKTRIPAVHHDRHRVDGEEVARPKVLPVTFLRNAFAMIAAALLPGAMLRLPMLRAMRLPGRLVDLPLFRRRLGMPALRLVCRLSLACCGFGFPGVRCRFSLLRRSRAGRLLMRRRLRFGLMGCGPRCRLRSRLGFLFAPLGPRCRRMRFRSEEHTSELQSRQYLVCRL